MRSAWPLKWNRRGIRNGCSSWCYIFLAKATGARFCGAPAGRSAAQIYFVVVVGWFVFLLVGGWLVFWGRCFGGSWGRKVAYVLRFRYVVFTTLRNQLIFYGKTCWFRSVVTPTSRKRNTYTTFACWVEASSGWGGHFSMDFSLKRLCKIGIFAILRSPRCATSTFFDKK